MHELVFDALAYNRRERKASLPRLGGHPTMTANRPASEHESHRESIIAYLKTVAREELELSEEQIEQMDPDTPIVEALQLDSVTQVVLITAIEEHYGFEFEFEDGARLHTIGDLVEMIRGCISGERSRGEPLLET
jgi:acyl carrier protein